MITAAIATQSRDKEESARRSSGTAPESDQQDAAPAKSFKWATAGVSDLSSADAPGLAGRSKVWALIEKLNGEKPANAAKALESVAPAIAAFDDIEVRKAIVKALRTEDPPHFAFPEVRKATLEALTPYVEDDAILKVFVEEVESKPASKLSWGKAIEVINARPPIEDQKLVDRLTELFIRERNNPAYENILATLSPRFGREPSGALIFQLQNIATELYSHEDTGTMVALRALGLSQSPYSIDTLNKLATGEVYEKFKFFGQGDYDGGWVAGVTFISTVISTFAWLVTCSNRSIQDLPFNAGSLALKIIVPGAIAGFFALPTLCYLFNKNSRKMATNNNVSSAAMGALALAGQSKYAVATITKAFENSGDVSAKETLRKNLEGLRSSASLSNLKQDIKDPSPYVRRATLEALAAFPENKVRDLVTACEEDPDESVRKLAYHILDSYKT